jgi:hypothetical protein
MVSSFEIVGKIREYLSGQSSLDAFREWIVGAHLEMEDEKKRTGAIDQDAARLLADIEGRYAELSDEIVSEEFWRKRVAALISPVPQSAESYLLTYFYSIPSVFHSGATNVSAASSQTGNINRAFNFQPIPEPDRAAA